MKVLKKSKIDCKRGLREGGGTVWNTLKWGITEKEGKLGQGLGVLERGRGLEPPYELLYI